MSIIDKLIDRIADRVAERLKGEQHTVQNVNYGTGIAGISAGAFTEMLNPR